MKTVIELAREAGFFLFPEDCEETMQEFYKFAELVRAEEREACAKVCGELLERPSGYQGAWEGYGKFKTQMTGQECATAIRARSNT